MKFKFLVTAALALFLFSACEKESTPSTKSIHGLWIGTYNATQKPAQGDLFYSYIIYPDGTMLTKGKGGDGKFYYSTGTWTLNGNNFSSTIVSFVTPNNGAPVTQSINGTYSDNGTITAVWADTNNPNGAALSGNHTMQKVN